MNTKSKLSLITLFLVTLSTQGNNTPIRKKKTSKEESHPSRNNPLMPFFKEQERFLKLMKQRQELRNKTGISLHNIILFLGPTDNSKKLFARTLAEEMDCSLYIESSKTIENITKHHFESLNKDRLSSIKVKPTIIFMDLDIEKIPSFFSYKIEELIYKNDNIIIIFGTSNPQYVSKFTYANSEKVYFNLPDKEHIVNLLQIVSKDKKDPPLWLADEMVNENFSYNDVMTVLKYATINAFLDESTIEENHYNDAIKQLKNEKNRDKKLNFESTAKRISTALTLMGQLKEMGYDKGLAIKMIQNWGYDGDLKKELPE